MTSIEDNKIMETALKGCMLVAVSTEELELRSSNKCSEKDVSV